MEEEVGRKRKTQDEAEEVEWDRPAAKVLIKEGGTQSEMTPAATMRNAEKEFNGGILNGVRSGLRPELGTEWEGRNEPVRVWSELPRKKR